MNKIELSEKDEEIFNRLNSLGAIGKRALFIFQYLFLRKDFRDFVSAVRETEGLPKNGLDITKKKTLIFLKIPTLILVVSTEKLFLIQKFYSNPKVAILLITIWSSQVLLLLYQIWIGQMVSLSQLYKNTLF
ncbi:MAG: hypothetical protein RLZZ308_208 [Candidatus Parcubacteria bacterium]|jgi:hypothetical protein